jgi:hypothetical protein
MSDEKLEKLAEFITTNPSMKRDYYTNPLCVLERTVPKDEARRAELRGIVEQKISNDETLEGERKAHFEDYRPARLIAHNPRLRTRYFESPGKVLASAIPRRGLLERIRLTVPPRVERLREELGDKVEAVMSNDPRLLSDREAAVETNVFLSDALRNPKRAFNAVFWLSILAFFIGVGFLAVSIVAAFIGEVTTQKAVLGSASGGSGAVVILGTVFTISQDSIRNANRENAQIRLALTGFATVMAHLRAIPVEDLKDVEYGSKEIRGAMRGAVRSLLDIQQEKHLVWPEHVPARGETAGLKPKTAGKE